MIRDIIWDFDGTLFDTYPGIVGSFKKALKDYGIEETEENILDYFKISANHAITHFKELYGLDNNFVSCYKVYEKAVKPEMANPFPFAEETLKGIVELSGRNYIITHRGGSTLKFLEYYGMTNYFTEIVTKHNGFKRKPDPESFIYLIEKYKLDRSATMVVGDRDFEILGGKAAEIKTCLFNTNKINASIAPDFSIDSLIDILNIIN